MKRVLAICLFAASTALVGCGEPQSTDIMQSADQSAVDEYERLVAEQDAAADAGAQGDIDAEADAGAP